MTNISKTTDYNIFKYLAYNRDIDPKDVQKLADSISQHNLLNANPIIVDDEMHVIDGQHRLEAAKKLEVPIYYTVTDAPHADDMIILNANQRTWPVGAYIKYWIYKGKKDYQWLKDTCEKYGVNSEFISRRCGCHNTPFKLGAFQISDEKKEWMESVLTEVKLFMDEFYEIYLQYKTGNKWLYSMSSIRALFIIFASGKIDRKKFIERICSIGMEMSRRANCQQYIDMYLTAWNWRAKNRISSDDLE